METKKSKKASLQKKRNLYLEIGLLFSLAVCLVAFEWPFQPNNNQILLGMQSGALDEILIPVTRMKFEPPPPPPPPDPIEIILIVADEKDIKEIIFDIPEVDGSWENNYVPIDIDEPEVSEPFFEVEDMPKFNGGEAKEFRRYLAKNLQYPSISSSNGIGGRVFVQFVVSPKGEVVDVIVVKGVDPYLDAEAVRVVESSPRWTPGKQRGRPVKVLFTFQVMFALQN